MASTLAALPQHYALVEWLRVHEKEVWDWFADAERRSVNAEEVRMSLLRDTYRLDAEAHVDVFREIDAAKTALGLDIEIHAYQSQGQSTANAAICYLPGEAHLIFSGPILTLLSVEELRGVIGHELAHYLLWQMEGGAFYLADRILHQAAAHPAAEASHLQSARLWSLATELFADRGAFIATNCMETAVAGLVKVSTGISQVSGKSYLAQAGEIFSKSKPKTEEYTHPETFMRAHALQLWSDQHPDLEPTISSMLSMDDGMDSLDIIQQTSLTKITRRFITQFLRPKWFQSDAVLAHARLYFPDFKSTSTDDAELMAELAELPSSKREYLCQVMLDFCAVDQDLEEMPVAAGIEWSRDMECLGAFEKLATKALKVKAKDMKRLKEKASEMLAREEVSQS